VVVIGRNEGERLIRCLASLEPFQNRIVYVDSGSTDGSIDAARTVGAAIVQLDTTEGFTAARARNAGCWELLARFSDLSFVQFIDGDCELNPGWLPSALAFMQANEDVAVACGRRRERYPEASLYNRLCDLEWNTTVGLAAACGGDALMRVSAIATEGGFDGALMAGEEPELCARLRAAGWKIWRLDQEMTLHDAAMTRLGQWWLRSVRGGYGFAQVWFTTRKRIEPLYQRELARAAVWGGLLPSLTAVAALMTPIVVVPALSLYVGQVARIAVRRGARRRDAWLYGVFAVLSKLPEFQGLLRYAFARRKRRHQSSIMYK
jgi:GT2 family glycosyltransferase